MQHDASPNASEFDPDVDRYPSLLAVLSKIPQVEDMPTGPVERVEVTCLASGESTVRVWAARAEEPVGMYFPPADAGEFSGALEAKQGTSSEGRADG